MINIKEAGILGLLVLCCALATVGVARADNDGRRADKLHSKGIMKYSNDQVVIDSSDLTYLADEIDTLEKDYKTKILSYLNGIGTYLKSDGSVTHTPSASDSPDRLYDFSMLLNGIYDSQSSQTAFSDLGGTAYYKTRSGGLSTSSDGEAVSLAAAAADHLSAGKVAYVDGNLLLGTGADNEAYYRQGYADGYEQGYADGYNKGYADGYAQKIEGLEIQYHYHTHAGSVDISPVPDDYVYYSLDNPGGCFVGKGHAHDKTGTCKSHTATCGGTLTYHHHDSCVDSGSGWGTDNGHVSCGWVCDKCHDWPKNSSGGTCQKTSKVYDCKSPTNIWKLNCGKTTDTIESATIVYP